MSFSKERVKQSDSCRCSACWLTAAARSAIAVIAIRGEKVAALLAPLFQSNTGRQLQQAAPGDILFGRWIDGGEELVLVNIDSENIEVHCHGGVAAAPHILSRLERHGVVIHSADQWALAPAESETVNDALRMLRDAATPKMAAALLAQTRGAWDRAAASIERRLADPNCPRDSIAAAIDLIEQHPLSGPAPWSRPWTVGVIGAPNAGKSTLINAIVGYQRSVVLDQPGTTRDLIQVDTVLGGWPVRLLDTAGLRESSDPIEREGVRRALETLDDVDLVLELVDLNDPVRATPKPPADRAILVVGNKRDLLRAKQRDRVATDLGADLTVSAQNNEAVPELLARLQHVLLPTTLPPESPSTFGLYPSVPESPSTFGLSPSVPESPSTFGLSPSVPESPSTLGLYPSVPESPSTLGLYPSVPESPSAFAFTERHHQQLADWRSRLV